MAKEHKSHRKPSPKPLHHKPELLSGLWPSAGRDHQGLALLQVGNDDCRTIATQFLSYTLHIILHMYVRMYVMLYVKCYRCMYVCMYLYYVCGICLGRTIRPPQPGPPNHTYSTSPICKTHGSRTAFAVLELAGALAEVPSSGGHTLNQLWWKLGLSYHNSDL